MTLLSGIDPASGAASVNPHMVAILRAYGVTHVLSPSAIEGLALVGTRATAHAFLYRIPGAARARFVATGHPMTDADAAKRLLDPGFDPDHEVLLQDTVDGEVPAASGDASAGSAPLPSVTARGTDMTIEADAPANGFLVIADTFYPGWTAEIDGTAVPIYRANLAVRAIPVTKGHHVARLHYEAPSWRTGLTISGLSIVALFGWWLAPSLPTPRPRGTSAPAPRG
jgi:hypothetical protein